MVVRLFAHRRLAPERSAHYLLCECYASFYDGSVVLIEFLSGGDPVVGVDLGVVRPAVTSNNRFLEQKRWREQKARILRLRRQLQAKGTKSSKRHLRKLSGKLFRQRRDHDHVLSKRIAQATPPGGTVVLENLTDIRSRVKQRHGGQSRRLHSWSFAQLQGYIRYKAEDRGQRVVLIDPRKTSQTCNRCGYASRGNRPKQALFRCRECGYQLNCDLAAARNIAAKYLAQIGIADLSGQPVKLPIVTTGLGPLVTSPRL